MSGSIRTSKSLSLQFTHFVTEIFIHYEDSRQIRSPGARRQVVRLLACGRVLSFGTRQQTFLYNSHTTPECDRYAPHGAHAEQYPAGRACPPCPDERDERLLGAGNRPRLDSYRSQGGGQAPGAGYREIVALARGVPAPCLAVEGGARGDYPQTAPPAGASWRLGAYRIHDGRGAFAQRHPRLRGSL